MDTQVVVAVFVAFLVAAVPVALLVTKAVDLVRSLLDPSGARTGAAGWLWIVLAFVFGVLVCLGWQFNPMAALVHAVPALSNSDIADGVMGQVISGLAIGAMAGFWHGKLAQWSALAADARASAASKQG